MSKLHYLYKYLQELMAKVGLLRHKEIQSSVFPIEMLETLIFNYFRTMLCQVRNMLQTVPQGSSHITTILSKSTHYLQRKDIDIMGLRIAHEITCFLDYFKDLLNSFLESWKARTRRKKKILGMLEIYR